MSQILKDSLKSIKLNLSRVTTETDSKLLKLPTETKSEFPLDHLQRAFPNLEEININMSHMIFHKFHIITAFHFWSNMEMPPYSNY